MFRADLRSNLISDVGIIKLSLFLTLPPEDWPDSKKYVNLRTIYIVESNNKFMYKNVNSVSLFVYPIIHSYSIPLSTQI